MCGIMGKTGGMKAMDKQRVLVTHAIPREGLDDLFDRFEVIYP